MAEMRTDMPSPADVDPMFDGHPERTLLELTPDERIDWIWATMELLREARGLVTHQPTPDKGNG